MSECAEGQEGESERSWGDLRVVMDSGGCWGVSQGLISTEIVYLFCKVMFHFT